MPAPTLNATPAVKRELRTLGAHLKEARVLRRMPMELVAERAGTTRSTLYRIERGDPNVRVGSYMLVLQALGLLKGFGDIEDTLGDQLSTEKLPKRVRSRE
ncbi:MAG: helix-turn-helix domain-containing protein [Rhodobacteraceae bacterium]|nr:helix-turn-helix domain-containing protein [Paracoccaceae bacterium]MCB1470374.1 helix-turn-helix transcriptional regulator [Rhizobiaceae bacterium]